MINLTWCEAEKPGFRPWQWR